MKEVRGQIIAQGKVGTFTSLYLMFWFCAVGGATLVAFCIEQVLPYRTLHVLKKTFYAYATAKDDKVKYM